MIATAIAAIVSIVLIEFVFPIVGLLLTLPFMAIGRRFRRIMLLMWFTGRYGAWLLEVGVFVLLVFWAQDRFNIAVAPVFVVAALCLFHTLAVLYVFDAKLFNSMSGVWHIVCEERA